MKRIFYLTLVAGILVSSCTMPSADSQTDAEISTAAAMTVQAALEAPAAPLATPTLPPPPSSGESAPPESPSAQATETQPSGEARANFDDVINCRTGPGVNYDRIFQTKEGDSYKIVGFFPPNFWIISTTAGDCWIAGQYATPVGDLEAVPTVTMPPTPSGGAPKAPSFSTSGWTWFCNGAGQAEVALAWNDNADAEKGYRVYRNAELIAELPANSNYFTETVIYPGGQGLKYEVEAFNEIGSASISTDTMFCN